MSTDGGMRRRSEEPLHPGDPRCANMTAILLCRKSTATEGKSKSVAEQLEILREDARRFGFGRTVEILEREGDKGEWWWRDAEGRNPGPYREGLTAAVGMIESGEAQAVLVHKVARLVRDSGLNDALAKLFRRHKVHLVSGGRDREIDTARGLCDNAIEAARAREWRDQISEDVCRDKDYKFRTRMFTRNPSCYGMASKGRGSQAVEFDRERLAVVRRIFSWFVGEGCARSGTYKIAQRLMGEGVSLSVGARGHKPKDPTLVDSTLVANVLRNPQYAALWEHRGERAHYPRLLVPPQNGVGDPQPAVPVEVWEEAQRLLEERPRCGNKAASSERLLAGLVVCGACGRNCHCLPKTLSDGTKIWRWHCAHRIGKRRSCHGASYASILVEDLDRWATDCLAPILALDLEGLREERADGPLAREVRDLERRLAEARESEARALRRALSLDEAQFQALARELREEREALERRLREAGALLGDAGALGAVDPERLRSQEREELREGLRRAVRWIALTADGPVVHVAAGHLMAARFQERDPSVYSTSDNRRTVRSPVLDDYIACPDWFADPAAFVAGRRWALGAAGVSLSALDILPDVEHGETPSYASGHGVEESEPPSASYDER